MKKNNILIAVVLFLIVLTTRIPFLEQFQSHWDGPQFSIGVIQYSLVQETPVPPGYPVYIFLGKMFYTLISDPHKALLFVGVFATALCAILYYFVGKKIFSPTSGLIASLLYLSGSTFYFLSLTAHGYVLIPLATLLFSYCGYLLLIKKSHVGLAFGLSFAFAVGIRPQEAIFLLPLFLYCLFSVASKEKLLSVGGAIIGIGLWLLPTAATVGGLNNYYMIVTQFGSSSISGVNIFTSSHELMLSIAKGFFLSFGIGLLFLLYYPYVLLKNKRQFRKITTNKLVIFFALWIIPSLFFNIFVRSDQAGHQMTYLSALPLLIGNAITLVSKNRKQLTPILVAVIILFNLYTFFRDRDPLYLKPSTPTSFHYSEIRKNDLKLGAKVHFIQNNFDPKKTLLVSSDILWRPYMYHLREYHLVALSGLDTNNQSLKYTQFWAFDWKRTRIKNNSLFITIPSGISTVVFMDDGLFSRIKNYPITPHTLAGKTTLTEISVQQGDKIFYNYNTIIIQSAL